MGNIKMTINNNALVERAEQIAAKNGGSWEDHLIAARREAYMVPLNKLHKKSDRRDEALRKRATLAAHDRQLLGVGSADPDRRIEVGEVETQLGRLRISVSREEIGVHGVNVALTDIDRDLREAIVETSASFAAAAVDVEQSKQRTLVGLVIDGVLRRHEFLTAKVREAKRRERYDV
jgi:hypothetical protein